MPVVDGVIASYNAAAALKPQASSSAADSGTDNRTVQQFQEVLQQQAPSFSAPPAPPQPPQSQPAAWPQPTTNSNAGFEIDFSRLTAPSQIEQSTQPSALNYGASGTPNPVRDLNQAGKVISLSV